MTTPDVEHSVAVIPGTEFRAVRPGVGRAEQHTPRNIPAAAALEAAVVIAGGSQQIGPRLHGARILDVDRNPVVVVRRVKKVPLHNLRKVVRAGDALAARARLVQRRQQHRGQNPDDRNDDQKLNQSESLTYRAEHVIFPGMFLHLSISCG